MKRAILLLSLLSAQAFACSEKEFTYGEGQKIKLCQRGEELFSTGCDELAKCFTLPTRKLTFHAYQNPLFSLCYEMKGQAYFVKGARPICVKDGKVRDLESLMRAFNK